LARRAVRQKKEFVVTVQFESNRLSEECLAAAYELALPLVEHDTAGKRKQRASNGKTNRTKERQVV
jgi:hypothetical protein